MAQLPVGVRSAVRFFGFYLANGTLARDLLDGIDYRPALIESGSALEQCLAVFVNLLEVDGEGNVLNEAAAARRAAQWIRSHCQPGYMVDPPFADWETELI